MFVSANRISHRMRGLVAEVVAFPLHEETYTSVLFAHASTALNRPLASNSRYAKSSIMTI